ncbi:MAG: hypothetical protein AAF394_07820, partial [Planctomycetota bacterium]
MPATAEPAPKKRSPKRVKKKPGRQAAEKSKPTEAVEAEAAEEVSAPASIEELQEELAKYKEFFGEIDSFVSFVADRKKALLEVAAREAELKEELKSVKEERQQLENAIGGAKDSLYHLVEPGAMEYMPLLDKMEPADPEKPGDGLIAVSTDKPRAQQYRGGIDFARAELVIVGPGMKKLASTEVELPAGPVSFEVRVDLDAHTITVAGCGAKATAE